MAQPAVKTLAIGSDHAGFTMKQLVIEQVRDMNIEVCDCGTYDDRPCDFPDIAEQVAMRLLDGQAERGILVCGSGVGVSVAANKFPGIRASLCHDTYSAHQGVEHDNMNVLCVGARVIGPALALEIVQAFLQASYAPEPRHAARVAKIADIEQRVMQGKLNLPQRLQHGKE